MAKANLFPNENPHDLSFLMPAKGITYLLDRTTQAPVPTRLTARQMYALTLDDRKKYLRWPEGGGLVHVDADIDPRASVCVNTVIAKEGKMGPNATMEGHAWLSGTLTASAVIKDLACVKVDGAVNGQAIVGGSVVVESNGRVSGKVRVGGLTRINAGCHLSGIGFVSCCVDLKGNIVLPAGYFLTVEQLEALRSAVRPGSDGVQHP